MLHVIIFCPHKREKNNDPLFCLGKEQSLEIQPPSRSSTFYDYSPSSYSLVMHNLWAKYRRNVPGHRCAVRQTASLPLWTYDKCLCIWFSECWNEGTWKRKMIRREWTHGDGGSWESFTHEQLSDCGNFQKFRWLFETWATLCFCSLPRTHSPVAEVPEEIGVVHLQLLSWHIRSEVLGWTVG